MVNDANTHPVAPDVGAGQPFELDADDSLGGGGINGIGENVAQAALHQEGVHLQHDGRAVPQHHAHSAALDLGLREINDPEDELVHRVRRDPERVVL